MAVSKRTFEVVAQAIRDNTVTDGAADSKIVFKGRLVNALADYFEAENGHFDRERFVKACGID